MNNNNKTTQNKTTKDLQFVVVVVHFELFLKDIAQIVKPLRLVDHYNTITTQKWMKCNTEQIANQREHKNETDQRWFLWTFEAANLAICPRSKPLRCHALRKTEKKQQHYKQANKKEKRPSRWVTSEGTDLSKYSPILQQKTRIQAQCCLLAVRPQQSETRHATRIMGFATVQQDKSKRIWIWLWRQKHKRKHIRRVNNRTQRAHRLHDVQAKATTTERHGSQNLKQTTNNNTSNWIFKAKHNKTETDHEASKNNLRVGNVDSGLEVYHII